MKQDFLDAVSSLVGRLMEDSIHTSAPSKVGKVENNHTAKLTPNLKVTTDDGREVPYPEISGTIILMPCGAGKKGRERRSGHHVCAELYYHGHERQNRNQKG